MSVLIAESRDDVTMLNNRARADLILDGVLKPGREVEMNDGTAAGSVTRSSPAATTAGSATAKTGSATVNVGPSPPCARTIRSPSARLGRRFGGSIVLPASYVAEHVDLGYAVTAHRAQGITAGTAHVLVAPTMTQENLYVAMTRGCEPGVRGAEPTR